MTRFARAALAVGIVLWVLLASCYILRPEPLALLTTYPTWTWPLLGVLLSLVVVIGNRRWTLVILAMSLLFFLTVSEEPRSLMRGLTGPSAGVELPGHLRVMSINCAGGRLEAAEEALAFSPDIVLLQESPSEVEVAQVARKLFGRNGRYVWGCDCSIVADGKVEAVPFVKTAPYFIQARVTRRSGEVIGVVSIHLTVPPYDFNPFLLSNWRSQARHRQLQTEQMQDVLRSLADIPPGVPLIVGGDFNAPAGDPAIGLLRQRLRDSFTGAGVGWGKTIINDTPVHRIDQVWINDVFEPTRVEAVKSVHSDHRMVVCDVVEKTAD